jgi:D-alanyl-D-alanine carboxypeptidase
VKANNIIKIVFIAALIIMEVFVWDNAYSSSIGIIGGADGPTSIIISGGKDNTEKEDKNQGSGERTEGRKSNTDEKDIRGEEPSDIEKGQSGKKDQQEKMDPQEEIEVAKAMDKGLLILVNKKHPIDKDYKPTDLKAIKYFAPDRTPASRYMRSEAADAFHTLVENAVMEDIEIIMTTAYRSYGFQQILYDGYVQREGQAAADKFSAKPGQSEHQTGLAVDVTSASVGYALTGDFANTKEGKWLADNAHKFGFIIRFPAGKEDITGYMYEPWHIRYVGKPVAEKIYNQGITLEEYLEKVALTLPVNME